MNIKTVIEKAYRFCKRNITATQKGGVLKRMMKVTGKSLIWEVDSTIPTACWSFDHARDRHHIKCGTSLGKIANADTNACERKMKLFVQAVIRHETEHGICTDRTSNVSDACSTNGIPFRLWNLFEDARIEFDSATRIDGDGAFRWVNYQDVAERYNVASSLLWAIKTNEAGIKKQPSAYVPKWTGADEVRYKGKDKKTRLVVLDFYRRAISCNTSMDLIPVLMEWIAIFGKEVPKETHDTTINGKADPNDNSGDTEPAPQAGDDTMPHQERKAWGQETRSMNDSQISRIARAMDAVIQNAKVVKNRLSSNGNRLHASQAMQGSERSFLNRGRTNGKRSVALIVDTSGSMQDTYGVHGGKEFILAFRQLAKQNKIDLEILLTQVDHRSGRNVSKRITNQSNEWINCLEVDGCGEGIMDCFKRWMPVIKRCTTSVVFTDSCLNDRDIDIQQYRNMGLNTIATYIEPNDRYLDHGRRRMNEHFARSVIAQDATELARRLMREVLKD